ncbi:Helix-turn-helix [Loktanella sp. DSM 29012]|uniref:Helix-turn-helix domain-containing protein n=1 Tax=Loktanella gaetbuli TaxID=2881335 RepID=A0ABS8BVQ6_9RHOB|nr:MULTISPECIES: helix-turn-helix transcriptional regulator [Loktanella]MCB5199581.1 helix-turn-helix domain-containing protein [Loktanella gaetbuli]SEQ03828.1 Helix-turn-helix [Loktanella sp. DSM 29012]
MQDNDWYSDDAATFGDRLTAARDAAGMSVSDLAKKLGVKTGTVSAWEEDLKEPRANRLSMMAGMLNVSLGWLLTGEGEGVAAPDDVVSIAPEISELLSQMRDLRMSIARDADKLARLEKRLRRALEVPQ